MTQRQPAVGRPVHYVIPVGERGDAANECQAAIITAVKDPAGQAGGGIVDLHVLGDAGSPSRQDVSHVNAEHRVGGTWHWMEHAEAEAATEVKVSDLARVTLNPGDRLVLRVTDYTPNQMRKLGEYLEAQIPGHQVIVVPGDLGILAETPEPECCGRAIITWPAPDSSGALPNWGVAIHDADTGEQVLAGFKISLVLGTDTGYESAPIEADITALVDENGDILADGNQPIVTDAYREHRDRIKRERLDGPLTDEEAKRLDALDREFTRPRLRTGVFRYVVAEMRVAGTNKVDWLHRADFDECIGTPGHGADYLGIADDALIPVCQTCACNALHPGSPATENILAPLPCPGCQISWEVRDNVPPFELAHGQDTAWGAGKAFDQWGQAIAAPEGDEQ